MTKEAVRAEILGKVLDVGYREWLDEVFPDNYILERGKFENRWVSGGVTGGDCWGGVADRPMSGEPEPEWIELDEFLEEVAPNISFLQYRELMRSVDVDDDMQSEYYGNYTTYAVKTLKYKDIYDFLVEKGFYKPYDD